MFVCWRGMGVNEAVGEVRERTDIRENRPVAEAFELSRLRESEKIQ